MSPKLSVLEGQGMQPSLPFDWSFALSEREPDSGCSGAGSAHILNEVEQHVYRNDHCLLWANMLMLFERIRECLKHSIMLAVDIGFCMVERRINLDCGYLQVCESENISRPCLRQLASISLRDQL